MEGRSADAVKAVLERGWQRSYGHGLLGLSGHEAGELDVGCDDWGETIWAAVGSYQACQSFEMSFHRDLIPGERLGEEENSNAENVCLRDPGAVSYPSRQSPQGEGFVS